LAVGAVHTSAAAGALLPGAVDAAVLGATEAGAVGDGLAPPPQAATSTAAIITTGYGRSQALIEQPPPPV
jgi:hypothetical protein